VVEHSLGKGEVLSSILSGSTIGKAGFKFLRQATAIRHATCHANCSGNLPVSTTISRLSVCAEIVLNCRKETLYWECAMTVEIRQAGSEWLVEVKGEPIGVAESMAEANALAHYWQARLDCIARWRRGDLAAPRQLPSREVPGGRLVIRAALSA
jgi:hypothetical protein